MGLHCSFSITSHKLLRMWHFKREISFNFVCMFSSQFTWAVGAKSWIESYLIITTGQLVFFVFFLQEFDVELKNENLETVPPCLTTFSKWAVVQQLHVVTLRFVLQYILTCEVNVLKFRPVIYFDKTNVTLTECFCLGVKWKHDLMVIYSNVFFQCASLSVHTVDVKMNLKKRGKKGLKKGAFDRKKCTQLWAGPDTCDV